MAVDFGLSDDQQALHDVFADFFANECTSGVVRDAEPLGFAPELWNALRAMEAPSMAASGEHGGGGASLSELVVVAETFGSAVAPVPLIGHWVASSVLSEPDLVSGASLAAVALRPADANQMWTLVPGGAVADTVVGVDGDELVAVQSAAPGVAPTNHASAPLADRSATSAQRWVLGEADDFVALANMWKVLTASALVGVAQRALDIGVAYVLEREQFGRPIGSFQALQHGLAELPALIDGARFLAHKAAWSHDSGFTGGQGVIDMDNGIITECSPLAAMAFLQASEAAAVTTDTCLQYHGGYGFSEEYDIQLYYRRARGWAGVAGDPAEHRRALADHLWPRSA
jgi:alkylation response protein AidB-like acyl-CoA dehydrogenase